MEKQITESELNNLMLQINTLIEVAKGAVRNNNDQLIVNNLGQVSRLASDVYYRAEKFARANSATGQMLEKQSANYY